MDTHIQLLVYEHAKVHLHFMSMFTYRQLADPATSAPNVGLTPAWPVRVSAKCFDRAAGAAYRAWVCVKNARYNREPACTSTIHEFVTDVSHWLGRIDVRIIFMRHNVTLTEPMSIGPGDPLLWRLRKWLDLRLLPWAVEHSGELAPPEIKKRRVQRAIHGDDDTSDTD